mgnify:CR=1 FL=1
MKSRVIFQFCQFVLQKHLQSWDVGVGFLNMMYEKYFSVYTQIAIGAWPLKLARILG